MEEKIPDFVRNDYLMSTTPYEWLYQFKDNQFELRQLLNIMSERAKEVGVRNLATLFKDYIATIKGDSIIRYNRTDFTRQPMELDCGAWSAGDDGIYSVSSFGLEITACYHPIMPVERLINIDTSVHKVKLAFSLGGRWNSIIEDRSVVSDSRSIIGLSKYGIAVNSETGKHLVRYLSEVEQCNYEIIPETPSVGRLGWIDGYGFSPYVDGLVFDGEDEYRTRFEAIREKGSRDAWLKACLEVRSGSTAGNVIARLLLASSFASVLVKVCNCLPFFVHLWGGSETGKTVGLLLAASVWGDPEPGKYVQTMNATEVSKELGAAFCNSLPLIIDELQLIQDKRKDFDKMIYQLAEGVGRGRGKKTGGLQKTPTWRNCIMTTGEFPIISPNSGAGAVNRTLEIDCHDIHLFDDPKKTVTTLYGNYGFAGKEFVSKLNESGAIERIQKMQDDMQAAIKSDDTMDKQTASAALILTADALIEEWIFHDGVRLTASDIKPFLASKSSVNQNARALQFLYDFISINQNKFSQHPDYSGEIWGDLDNEYAYIIKSKFDQILNDEGFNATAFIGWAKKLGVIELGNDGKSTKGKRILGKVTRCIWLKIDTSLTEEQPDFTEIDENSEQYSVPFED